METTNKKLAFLVAVIGIAIAQLLPLLNPDVTQEQQKTLMDAILLICGAFGIADVGWDYLNVARRNFDIDKGETVTTITASETPVVTTTVSTPPFTENHDLGAAG